MLLDVCFVRYSVEWSGTVPKVPLLWKGKDRPKLVGFKWVGLDGLTSHPLHMRHSTLFRLMQRSVIGLSLAA
jgi:hypothetical protein